ncbi:MAG: CocE/NonD family hydrolase [Cyanobacteria bacterium J069]
MYTRDQVRLDADVYYPDAEGPFPVLLMRQPYGRAIASTVVYAHPAWYAAHGYIVVIQDVRGRGTSEGEFSLFASEINDGYDTVEWAAQLPGSTGQVGMYGFSYQGMTQLYAAIAQPSALKTICPSMVGFDLYADWAYEGGAFCYQNNLSWALQLASETARRQGDAEAYEALYAVAHAPFQVDPVCPRSELLERLAPDSFYHNWLSHADPADNYWRQLSPKTYWGEVDLPMLHLGGWFDTHLRGTLRLYRSMAARSSHLQHLWVGPWAHLPWGRRVGSVDYGPEASSPVDALQVRWFDQFLKGVDTGLLHESPVHLFDLGTNQWRSLGAFPNPPKTPLWLASNGLAAMGDQHGKLSLQLGPAPAKPESEQSAPLLDSFVHDPWRPVPALGGHATAPAGPVDRSALDSRTDVATYTSEPLSEDLLIAGEILVEVCCTADTFSFDLCAALSEVKPNGTVLQITQGYLRIGTHYPARPAPRSTITLQPTCIQLHRGSALRLSLSGASSPAYPVNAGGGTLPADSQLMDARVITVSVYSGAAETPSRVLLPVVKSLEL